MGACVPNLLASSLRALVEEEVVDTVGGSGVSECLVHASGGRAFVLPSPKQHVAHVHGEVFVLADCTDDLVVVEIPAYMADRGKDESLRYLHGRQG